MCAVSVNVVQGIQSLIGLEQLYMSTNRIADLSPLDGCRQLRCVDSLCKAVAHVSKAAVACRTLAMHRNALEDLDACLATLGSFPQLSGECATLLLQLALSLGWSCSAHAACVVADLDLSGNPIWFRPECKHRCVAELPALRRYDDEEVTDLDRELAAESSGGKPNALQTPA